MASKVFPFFPIKIGFSFASIENNKCLSPVCFPSITASICMFSNNFLIYSIPSLMTLKSTTASTKYDLFSPNNDFFSSITFNSMKSLLTLNSLAA